MIFPFLIALPNVTPFCTKTVGRPQHIIGSSVGGFRNLLEVLNETEAERRADFARFSFEFWKTLLDDGL